MLDDPLDFKNRPLISRLQRKRRLTALVMLAERFSASFWPFLSWLMAFAGLWLMQLPMMLGNTGNTVTLIVFLAGFAYLLRQALKSFRWPAKNEIDKRLEQASGLDHRPIKALEDKLTNPQKEDSRLLWQQNRKNALLKLLNLKTPSLQTDISMRDNYALRMAAVMLLVMGIVMAGPQWKDRLKFGLFPYSFGMATEQQDNITLWITPPEYTGLEQIILHGDEQHKAAIEIPEGSVLKVRMKSGMFRPVLEIGETAHDLSRIDNANWGYEAPLPPSDKLVIKQFPFTKIEIPYTHLKDTPPVITANGEPIILDKGLLQFPLKVIDDYSVIDMSMTMTLDPMIDDAPLGGPVDDERAVMSPPRMEIELQPVYDLAWHPWAGLPVQITFAIADYPGQVASLPVIKMTLPERDFRHPVAALIIGMRKRLAWTPEASAQNVGYELQDLLEQYESFGNDSVVFLSIRSAASRLIYDPTVETVADVISQLWDTALRIEDGNLSLASRNLRDAKSKLEQLLKDPNATQEDIAKAMADLQQAMAEYFQELARELQKRMAENGQMPMIPENMMNNSISPEDLQSFMEQLQAEALNGDKDSAREMLSQLENFMNMLDPSMNFEMPKDMQFMQEAQSQMQQLIEKQKELMEQTLSQVEERNAEEGFEYPDYIPFDMDAIENWDMGDMPPPPDTEKPANSGEQAKRPQIDTQANKVEQDALRYALGQLMLDADEQLDEIPENMQLAEQEMRLSADELAQNLPEMSVPHQQKAIDYLQDAMQDMQQMLMQRMKQMQMLSMGMGQGQLDPLGRPMSPNEEEGGNMFGGKVKIPDEAERKRVQEILRTLRQKSGELDRPDYELDYFRRLMKQF